MSVKIIHTAQCVDPTPPPLRRVDDQPFEPPPQLAAHIEATWQSHARASQRSGRAWYNGQVYSPLSVQPEVITVRQAQFRDFVGTRHLPLDTPWPDRVSPVSVALLPVEVEQIGGKIRAVRLFRRHGNSLDFAGYFSGLGGLMDPQLDGLDPTKTALREIAEECGVDATRAHLRYLGTACAGDQQSLTYCYLLELPTAMIRRGFRFDDGELTHSVRLPKQVIGIMTWKVWPTAAWVKAYFRLVWRLHRHRL